MALHTSPRASLLKDDFPHSWAETDAVEPPAIRTVDRLHSDAIRLGASDIHLEPTRDGGRVRLRIDGMLQMGEQLSAALFPAVVSRLKLMAG